jgi:hypothetical protein
MQTCISAKCPDRSQLSRFQNLDSATIFTDDEA